MSLLQDFMMEEELASLKKKILKLAENYKGHLNEGVLDFDRNDLSYLFDEAKKRYMAAKRGLALSNRLTDPAQKRENQSRVMGNLNKLRNFISKLERTIQDEYEAAKYSMQGKDLMEPRRSGSVRFNPDFNRESSREGQPAREVA